jgi:hypothetical protein
VIDCDAGDLIDLLQPWLDSATVESDCNNPVVTNDFAGFDEGCAALVTWTVTDDCGVASCSAMVTLIDTTAPVVMVKGMGPDTLECSTGEYVEPGATAADTCDPNALHVTIGGDDVDTSTPGTYTVTYTATDLCGNVGMMERTIEVVDTTAPEVLLNGDELLTLECSIDMYVEMGATATDACDPNVAVEIGGDEVDTTTPGTYIVTYTATDAEGNAGEVTRTVEVVDTTAPQVTLNGDKTQTLECSVDEYVEMGATAEDACDPNVAVEIGGDEVDTTTPGTYVVTYTAEDANGNVGQATRTIEVVDTIPPEITEIEVTLWPPNHKYVALSLSDCVEITDLCEGDIDIDARGAILAIYSDEPEDANGNGDGNTTDDIVIVDASSFLVRAERAGGGNGRVYGITFEFESAGETIQATCHVSVPHDQGGGDATDDGAASGYSVEP